MSGEISAGEAILRSLKSVGVDYLFANPGSDFAPIIEAYATVGGDALPTPILVAHEHLAVTLAHGYWLATARMQAAAVHVNVGLSNAVMGLLNAHADDVPLFLMSGRNPLTEGARLGGRRTPIQYGQEMFDQTALVREAVKWDYELRYGENAADLVARAAAIAEMEPKGAVYLSLPREPLAELTAPPGAPPQIAPSAPHPDPAAIAEAAKVLAEAESPLIIVSRGDAAGEVSREVQALAEENAIGISEVFVTRNVLPTDHPCNIGGDVAETMKGADAILVVDCLVAWIAAQAQPDPGAAVIHLGPDPLFARVPVRGYRMTQGIAANAAAGLRALRAAMPGQADPARLATLKSRHDGFRAKIDAAGAEPPGAATKPWIARCLSEIIGDGAIFAERAGPFSTFTLNGPNRWFGNTQAGGLGWGLPAAMGFQLANRDRLVAAVIGDGSYIFANPVACHQLAAAEALPVLTIIVNNGGYDAVRLSTREVYPGGAAARANIPPLTTFSPATDFAATARGMGCAAEKVERAADLPAALARAVKIIETERRQVLLDVTVAMEAGG